MESRGQERKTKRRFIVVDDIKDTQLHTHNRKAYTRMVKVLNGNTRP